jgi:hypothetical protein
MGKLAPCGFDRDPYISNQQVLWAKASIQAQGRSMPSNVRALDRKGRACS